MSTKLASVICFFLMLVCVLHAGDEVTTANPIDGNDQINPRENLILGWEHGVGDPANTLGYMIWFGTNETFGYYGSLSGVDSTGITIPADHLEPDQQYYWRVDKILNGSPEVTGTLWGFKTILTWPTIITSPATRQDPVKAGSNVAFYCQAVEPLGEELTYVWYVNGDVVPNAHDAKFVWHDIKATDHASVVYCEISSVNGSAESDTALVLVETCIAQFTFDESVDNDPVNYDQEALLAIGKESRFAYDCTLAGSIAGLDNTTGPNGSNALLLNGTAHAALVSNVKQDSNLHFSDYAVRAFITMSMWIKGFPDNDCYICGMEGGNRGYGFRKMGDEIAWTTRDHDKDGDMRFNYSSYANDGQWHHIVGYFGPNNVWTGGNGYDRGDKALFIDGVRVAAASGDYNRPGIGVGYRGMLFAIGCHAWDANSRGNWAGGANFSIDDVRVYNYALDTTEINYLVANPGANPECIGVDGDVNGDCMVDIDDLVVEAWNWLIVK